MIARSIVTVSILAAYSMPFNSPAAHANPATPMPVIESSAVQLCTAIDRNPNQLGVRTGLRGLEDRGFDDLDGALILLTAVHHVCPQYKDLVDATMERALGDQKCTKET